MSNPFRSASSTNSPPPAPALAMRIQQSVQGKARGFGYGKTRVAGNLIWYGDFQSYAQQSGGGGGGKGSGGGSNQSGGGSTTYSYTAAVAIALCEGPITTLGTIWNNKSKTTYSGSPLSDADGWGNAGNQKANFGLVLFDGNYSQSAWGYLTSLHPTEALDYRGTTYMAAGPLQLGSTPELPNITVEVTFSIYGAYGGTSDANPKDVIADFLSNTKYGIGFPSSRFDTNTTYSNYCIASGLVFSPFVGEQRPGADYLKDWMVATNSDFVWSSGALKIVPYGDEDLTAHGATYTAPSAPEYALTDTDFIDTSNNEGPVHCIVPRIEDQNNAISVEYLDALNDYNPTVVEAKDDAAIQAYGLKAKSVTQLHSITAATAAQTCASLMLGREQVRNSYTFTVPASFILLDPMDIVSLTDLGLGMSAGWVRIIEIQENDDYSLTMTAEDYLAGSGAAPLHGTQTTTGNLPNYNVSPGVVADPLIFEPTDQLAGGLEIWGAVTGADLSVWGGCEVWVSADGETYAKLEQDVIGPARVGVTTTAITTFTEATQGPTIDVVNTLGVDLTASHGSLASGSQADMLAFATLCYVDGEYIAYQTATVTDTYGFSLTTLNRGGYGTTPDDHAAGVPFCRIDQALFKLPFTQDRIGKTVYFKFLSFNQYGGGKLGLEDVGAVAYVIQGTALTSPLPDVENFVSSYVGNITYFDWDPVTDFRNPIQYEIRKGGSWDAGQFVGLYSHPHVPAIGDATYWIKAFCQPVPDLFIYSENATQLGINGSVIPLNTLASWDEFGLAWPGTLSGDVQLDSPFIITTGEATSSIDIITLADVDAEPDILAGVGIDYAQIGYYTIPDSHIINEGRNAPCLIQIIWSAAGEGATDDWFGPADWFAQTDIFNSVANQYIRVYPEIALSTDGVTFGPWQKYAAGYYNMWKAKCRMLISSIDTGTRALLTSMRFIVYAPDRVDNLLVNQLIGAGPLAVTFKPDNAASSAAFNGGPNGKTTPAVQMTIMNKQPGDTEVISSLSLAGCAVQVTNAGVGVQRNVTVQAVGY